MMWRYDGDLLSVEVIEAGDFAWRWTKRLVFVVAVMLLCSCQYTNCTFTSVKLDSGGCMTADVRQVPLDKSTTGAVTPTQTISPTTSVTGIPGM